MAQATVSGFANVKIPVNNQDNYILVDQPVAAEYGPPYIPSIRAVFEANRTTHIMYGTPAYYENTNLLAGLPVFIDQPAQNSAGTWILRVQVDVGQHPDPVLAARLSLAAIGETVFAGRPAKLWLSFIGLPKNPIIRSSTNWPYVPTSQLYINIRDGVID